MIRYSVYAWQRHPAEMRAIETAGLKTDDLYEVTESEFLSTIQKLFSLKTVDVGIVYPRGESDAYLLAISHKLWRQS